MAQNERACKMRTLFLQWCDNFYPDPDAIRARALSATYFVPKGLYGFRSTEGCLPAGTMERIKALFGFETIECIDVATRTTHFYHALSHGRQRVKFFAHIDSHRDEEFPFYSLVLYLTPHAPKNTGTGVYRHTKTGIWQEPTRAEAQRVGLTATQLRERLDKDAQDRSKWALIEQCENLYNRAVLFPAHWYHASCRDFGSRVENGRLYQAFFFRGFPARFLHPEVPEHPRVHALISRAH